MKSAQTISSPSMEIPLPPIQELDPRELKKYSKEQLLSYLHQCGVPASQQETKPELKNLLRQALEQLRSSGSSVASIPVRNLEPQMITEKNPSSSQHASSPMNRIPQPSPVSTPTARIGGSTPKLVSTSSTTNSVSQQQMGRMHTPTQLSNAYSSQQKPTTTPKQPTPSSYPNYPKSALQNPPKEVLTVLCPNCKKRIAFVGSNFLLHLSNCDSRAFMSLFVNQGAKVLVDGEALEYEASAFGLAKKNAIKRYKMNIEFLNEVFSPSSITELVNSMRPGTTIDHEKIEKRINDFMNFFGSIEKKKRKLEESSKEFSSTNKIIKTCMTEKEMQECCQRLDIKIEDSFPSVRYQTVQDAGEIPGLDNIIQLQ